MVLVSFMLFVKVFYFSIVVLVKGVKILDFWFIICELNNCIYFVFEGKLY